MDDRFSEAHHLLGLCLRARKRNPEAIRAFRRALAVNPAFVVARADLADLYQQLGRHREAIEQLEAIAALEPSRPERLVDVALAYARLGRTEAAITTLGRAAERYPEEPVVYTAIGRVWLESAEQRADRVALSKALEALQTAASRGNASAETRALYGRALFLDGQVDSALRMLREATTARPVEPDAFLWLAAACERFGDIAAAQQALSDYGHLVEERPLDALQAAVADVLRLQLRLRPAGPVPPRASRPAGRLPGR